MCRPPPSSSSPPTRHRFHGVESSGRAVCRPAVNGGGHSKPGRVQSSPSGDRQQLVGGRASPAPRPRVPSAPACMGSVHSRPGGMLSCPFLARQRVLGGRLDPAPPPGAVRPGAHGGGTFNTRGDAFMSLQCQAPVGGYSGRPTTSLSPGAVRPGVYGTGPFKTRGDVFHPRDPSDPRARGIEKRAVRRFSV